jgi:hypothetical protein
MASHALASSASVFMPLLTDNCLQTNKTLRIVLLITPQHGPHRKHWFQQFYCCVMQLSHGLRREHIFPVSPLVCVRNILPSNRRCLQSLSTVYMLQYYGLTWKEKSFGVNWCFMAFMKINLCLVLQFPEECCLSRAKSFNKRNNNLFFWQFWAYYKSHLSDWIYWHLIHTTQNYRQLQCYRWHTHTRGRMYAHTH